MLGSLIGPISSLAGTWLQGRVDKAKAETDVKVARARAEAKVYETEATSSMLNEQSLTSQMAGSWKDEAWTICFIAIIIFSFIPYFQPFVARGIEFLATFPEWLQWSIMASIGASFGLKSIGKFTK